MEQIIKDMIDAKIQSKDKKYPHNTTPEDGWYDAVYEARGYGVPIASFGDTSDKYVFHPGHLGYKFDYVWGSGSWISGQCWYDDDVKYDDRVAANEKLFDIGKYLSNKYRVSFVIVGGSDKGYLSTTVLDIKHYDNLQDVVESNGREDDDDYVLFVYCDNLDTLNL